MRILKKFIFLTSSSILALSSAYAQNAVTQPQAPKPTTATVTAPAPSNATPAPVAPSTGKSLNTPAATGGADYSSDIVTGLDDYNNRKKLLAEKAIELQKAREAEFRRQAYEQALKAAQEREKGRMTKATTNTGATTTTEKKVSNQDYFDRQTKILQEQKDDKK